MQHHSNCSGWGSGKCILPSCSLGVFLLFFKKIPNVNGYVNGLILDQSMCLGTPCSNDSKIQTTAHCLVRW